MNSLWVLVYIWTSDRDMEVFENGISMNELRRGRNEIKPITTETEFNKIREFNSFRWRKLIFLLTPSKLPQDGHISGGHTGSFEKILEAWNISAALFDWVDRVDGNVLKVPRIKYDSFSKVC